MKAAADSTPLVPSLQGNALVVCKISTLTFDRAHVFHVWCRDGLHFMTLAAQRAHAIGASSRSSSDQQNCQTQMDRSKWIDRDQQDSCWNDDLITEKRSVSERIVFRSCSNVQIRMIDFAHTLPSEQGIPDAGYIYGLSSLLRSLKKAQNIIDIEFANDILENVGSILQRNSENK